MEKLDMFQSISGKIDQFGCLGLERVSADAGTQFTLTEFKEEYQTHGVSLTLAAPEHQEMNGQVEVTWGTLRTVAHSHMVHARVSEAYINFELMYTTDNISPVLTIKDMINEYGGSHLSLLFCPCIIRKSTSHVDKKALHMSPSAKGFLQYLCWN